MAGLNEAPTSFGIFFLLFKKYDRKRYSSRDLYEITILWFIENTTIANTWHSTIAYDSHLLWYF